MNFGSVGLVSTGCRIIALIRCRSGFLRTKNKWSDKGIEECPWSDPNPKVETMNIIEQLEAEEASRISETRELPAFEPGDTVRVLVRVTEGQRTRVQAYEGVCIARSGGGINESFTVRKISYGEGVERVFPIFSPLVEGVEVVRRGKVRRAKLYYLRNRRGKSARITENTGTRAKKLNDAERQAMLEEKARIEAEKIAAAEQLAQEKAAEDAAAAAAEAEAKAAEADAPAEESKE